MRGELIGALFWLAIGVAIAWAGYGMGLGSFNDPGSGFLLFGLGISTAIVSLWIAARSLRTLAAASSTAHNSRVRLDRVFWVAVTLVGYISLLTTLGFAIATFAMLLVLLVALERYSWRAASIIAFAIAAVTYATFRYGLGTQLPPGILG